MKDFDYFYADPTGNITVLVKENVPVEEQPGVSDHICSKEPACEQVGFLYYDDPDADIRLRMAGGEFCGNATMTAAALYARENGIKKGETVPVIVRVSGADEPVQVMISLCEDGVYAGTVKMPSVNAYETVSLSYNGSTYDLPVVKFKGMYHVVMTEPLSKEDSEKAVVKWANDLNAPAFGIMALNEKENILTPLVYVPALNAYYWEHACASGTTAAGYYLYKKYSKPVSFDFIEPGGVLNITVESDDSLFLSGHVRFRD